MKPIAVYPKNRMQFLRLIQFGKEIISICRTFGSVPILYGSLAHFLYTGDTSMRVNDLDFLIPRKKMAPIFRKLKEEGAKEYIWKIGKTHTSDLMREARRMKRKTLIVRFPNWDGLVTVRNDLRVELDPLETTYKDTVWHRKLPRKFVSLDLYGEKIRMVSLGGMKQLYRIAYARSDHDKARIKRKIERFEIFMKK